MNNTNSTSIPNKELKSGYVGWAIPGDERSSLIKIFPPTHASVIAHHVTERIGVRSDYPLPTATEAEVVGKVDNGVVQALVVSINGSTARADGETYHITWSIDRKAGATPKDSIKAVREYEKLTMPIPIKIVPCFFPSEQQQKQQKPKPQKKQQMKEIQLSSNIGENDLQTKIKAAIRFIEDGDKVKVTLRLKGREITHSDIGFKQMQKMLAAVEHVGKAGMDPKLDGRQIIMILVPKGKKG